MLLLVELQLITLSLLLVMVLMQQQEHTSSLETHGVLLGVNLVMFISVNQQVLIRVLQVCAQSTLILITQM